MSDKVKCKRKKRGRSKKWNKKKKKKKKKTEKEEVCIKWGRIRKKIKIRKKRKRYGKQYEKTQRIKTMVGNEVKREKLSIYLSMSIHIYLSIHQNSLQVLLSALVAVRSSKLSSNLLALYVFPNPSPMSRTWHKVSFKQDKVGLNFRIFLFLDWLLPRLNNPICFTIYF